MLDRLMPVGGECSRGLACLPVEVDGGGEREDAGGDSADEPCWGLREVVFESELVFERVDDRLDPLADAPDWRCGTVWLVGPFGAQQQPAQLGDGRLELP